MGIVYVICSVNEDEKKSICHEFQWEELVCS